MHRSTTPGAHLLNGNPAGTIPNFDRWFGSWQVSVRRRPFNPAQLSSFYDREAGSWDRTLGRLGFPRAYEAMLRAVLQENPIETGSGSLSALDCGVGTGAMSAALARFARTPLRLYGIDISDRMLDRARDRLAGLEKEPVLQQADICCLPHPDNSFDLITVAQALHWFDLHLIR